MILNESDFKEDAVKLVAFLMAESAKTAPKAKGEDSVEIVLVHGEDIKRITDKMKELAKEYNDENFLRDARSVEKSQAILLMGVKGGKSLGLDCGACGFKSCKEFQEAERKEGKDFKGANCVFKILDLGIALGSAVKLASIMGVDTRIMYRVGTAARKLKLIDADVVMGIPIAALSKNPFFDR